MFESVLAKFTQAKKERDMFSPNRSILGFAAAAAVSAFASRAMAQISPGDLLIVNTSNTADNPNGHLESVALDEYNVSGSTPQLVQVIPLPGITMTSQIDDDRHLKLSVNGQLVTVAGYNAAQQPAGTVLGAASTDDAAYQSVTADRMVATVNAAGAVTYTDLGSSLYSGAEITAAITVNGSQFYLSGEDTGNAATLPVGGAQYAAVSNGQVTSSTPLFSPDAESGPSAALRDVGIFQNQLYYSAGSGSFGFHGVGTLGTGVTVPASSAPLSLPVTQIAGDGQSVNDFAFLDLTNSGSPDVAYYAAKDGIDKYIYNGTAWVSAAKIADVSADDEIKELSTETINGTVDIFAVDGAGNLFKIADTSPLTDSLSGTLLSGAYTPYIPAAQNDGGNELFGGVSFAPSAVPEPASMSALSLGAVALLGRRRPRKVC